jgi:glycosyltransferase involved in cell wall biosynthesis
MPTIECAAAAARYAEKYKIPLVLDIRDRWPDLFLHGIPAIFRRVARYGIIPYDATLRYSLKRAAAIFAISPEYLEWACGKLNCDSLRSGRVFPLGYMPQAARAQGTLQPKICWFLGSFGFTSDLETVIAAAVKLSRMHRTDIHFVLSGSGEKLSLLESSIQRERLLNLTLTGWLSRDQITQMMCKSYLGLACYSALATQGIPNKLTEYLSAGLPVISSLNGEGRQLISEFGCGYYYEAGNSDSLVQALLRLCDNAGQWQTCHENSLILFRRFFDASRIYPAMVRELEAIALSGCS